MIKRNLPLMITIGVFVLGYLYCLTQFPGFASTRVICNILTDNAFLGIIAVGMTFVILSGGIDLSVGSVIAFTGVFLAKVIGDFGLSPLLAVGDRVNVLAAVSDGTTSSTETICGDVRVIALDSALTGTPEAGYSLVTLDVTPEQAAAIVANPNVTLTAVPHAVEEADDAQ